MLRYVFVCVHEYVTGFVSRSVFICELWIELSNVDDKVYIYSYSITQWLSEFQMWKRVTTSYISAASSSFSSLVYFTYKSSYFVRGLILKSEKKKKKKKQMKKSGEQENHILWWTKKENGTINNSRAASKQISKKTTNDNSNLIKSKRWGGHSEKVDRQKCVYTYLSYIM